MGAGAGSARLKLLLDEMYPASIAEGVRARGSDALAVVECPQWRGLPDGDLFAMAQTQGRAVVTENVRDFIPVANAWDSRGAAHHGLVLVHPAKYPRGRGSTVGAMVEALAALAGRLGDDPSSVRAWL